MSKYEESIERIANQVVAPNADAVDAGAFPKPAIDALAESGLLGLITSPSLGGLGQGPRAAAMVVERLARACASTAMVACMHYCGAAVIEAYGDESTRRDIAAGRHLSTLAFSEFGSRSHFWAPVGAATRSEGGVRLDGRKSWVTSASKATAYVWSSRPLAGDEASTIWLVPRGAPGLSIPGRFDGLGMRGNDSTPVVAEGVEIPEANMLGADGAGFRIMMETALPYFNVMNAACSVGVMEGATRRTCEHVAGTKYQYNQTTLADLPTIRSYVARMRVKTDMARALLFDTVAALEGGRDDAQLRVFECKAAAGETATEVVDLAMRVCGGAAYRKDVGVERYFRDARAATVMAPTTDVLYDFIGRAACGLPLF